MDLCSFSLVWIKNGRWTLPVWSSALSTASCLIGRLGLNALTPVVLQVGQHLELNTSIWSWMSARIHTQKKKVFVILLNLHGSVNSHYQQSNSLFQTKSKVSGGSLCLVVQNASLWCELTWLVPQMAGFRELYWALCCLRITKPLAETTKKCMVWEQLCYRPAAAFERRIMMSLSVILSALTID